MTCVTCEDIGYVEATDGSAAPCPDCDGKSRLPATLAELVGAPEPVADLWGEVKALAEALADGAVIVRRLRDCSDSDETSRMADAWLAKHFGDK